MAGLNRTCSRRPSASPADVMPRGGSSGKQRSDFLCFPADKGARLNFIPKGITDDDDA